MNPPFLTFTWKVSWCFALGSQHEHPTNIRIRSQKKLPIDHGEGKLSTAAQELQRDIRQSASQRQAGKDKTKQRECLADAESLRVLERATAAHSEAARRQNDRESLATLLRHTNGQKMHRNVKAPKTPENRIIRYENFLNAAPLPDAAPFSTPSAVEKAIANNQGQIKGLNGTPRSFEPSWSTSSSEGFELVSGNEFEDYMTRSVGRAGFSAGKSNNGFSTLLRSAKSSPDDGSSMMLTTEMSQRAKSVVELIKEAEERDERDEEVEMVAEAEMEEEEWFPSGEGVAKQGDDCDKSPTDRIKRLPKSDFGGEGKTTAGKTRLGKSEGGCEDVAMSTASTSEASADYEDEWNVVGTDAPDSDDC